VRTRLVRVGNSRGVRLPKAVIEQARLGDELELAVEDGAVVIRPAGDARRGWAEAALACHEAGDDQLGDWDSTTADGIWK